MLMLTWYKRRRFRWDVRITAHIGSWEKKNTAFLIKTVFITCRVYINHNRSTLNLTMLISNLKVYFYNKSCNKDFYNKNRTSLTWIFMINVNIFTSNPYCFRPVWASEGKSGCMMKVEKQRINRITNQSRIFGPPQIFLFKWCRKLQNVQFV